MRVWLSAAQAPPCRTSWVSCGRCSTSSCRMCSTAQQTLMSGSGHPCRPSGRKGGVKGVGWLGTQGYCIRMYCEYLCETRHPKKTLAARGHNTTGSGWGLRRLTHTHKVRSLSLECVQPPHPTPPCTALHCTALHCTAGTQLPRVLLAAVLTTKLTQPNRHSLPPRLTPRSALQGFCIPWWRLCCRMCCWQQC